MELSMIFWFLLKIFTIPTIVGPLVLYLSAFSNDCEFPLPAKPVMQCMFDAEQANLPPPPKQIAPFRLLAIGDPQLEGDTSLPDANAPTFPSLAGLYTGLSSSAPAEWLNVLSDSARDLFNKDIPALAWSYRKRLDLWGNDRYLAHMYYRVVRYSEPTHITILGDLLGSQWISDDEFEKRSSRMWDVVLKGSEKVDDYKMAGGHREMLGEDPEWARRVISIAGNHDIGYAGDITRERADRFEKRYGKLNWDITFTLPTNESSSSVASNGLQGNTVPELQLIILNSMNLDGPAHDQQLQSETYDFINGRVIPSLPSVYNRKAASIILTHIPLHKEEGVCTDGPYFTYSDSGVREQNQISQSMSESIVEGIMGKTLNPRAARKGVGRNSIILNGHDHEGCDTYHFVDRSAPASGEQPPGSEGSNNRASAKDAGPNGKWATKLYKEAMDEREQKDLPGFREVTVRSIMGDFEGSFGFLSAWFDDDIQEWKFAYQQCSYTIPIFWWGVHVLMILWSVWLVGWVATSIIEARAEARASDREYEEELRRRKIAEEERFQLTTTNGKTPVSQAANGVTAKASGTDARPPRQEAVRRPAGK